ncbi:hypothetical protein GGS26DRAFT_604607 [Hypomontagnella submonticulosa]|nr:hypothetical protein GGS26DRAFT_604607 [Hypomontagnella submonticulosa]
MHQLTPELVHHILSFLKIDDIIEFRLVCKGFSEIGAEYICPRRFIFMTKEDLGNLVRLSNQTHIARGVKSLSYAPVTLVPGLSRDDYHNRQTSWGRYGGRGYNLYNSVSREQSEILKSSHDYACLVAALSHFPRLQHITLYLDNVTRNHLEGNWKPGRQISDALVGRWMLARTGNQHLRTLLRALSATKVRLESLTVRGLDWLFLDQKEIEIGSPFQAISHLKSLDLLIDTEQMIASSSSPDGRIHCCDHLSTGVLPSYLQTLTKLRELRVVFRDMNRIPIAFEPVEWGKLPLNMILPWEFTWANLTTLRLEDVCCERQELMEFLLRHKGTLRGLCLKHTNLISSSWIPLLDSIRKELYLTKPCICGRLKGVCEGPEDQDKKHQDWSLRRGNGLYELVNVYIMRGGEAEPKFKECPLPRDQIEPVTEQAFDFIKELCGGDLEWRGWKEIRDSQGSGRDRWADIRYDG